MEYQLVIEPAEEGDLCSKAHYVRMNSKNEWRCNAPHYEDLCELRDIDMTDAEPFSRIVPTKWTATESSEWLLAGGGGPSVDTTHDRQLLTFSGAAGARRAFEVARLMKAQRESMFKSTFEEKPYMYVNGTVYVRGIELPIEERGAQPCDAEKYFPGGVFPDIEEHPEDASKGAFEIDAAGMAAMERLEAAVSKHLAVEEECAPDIDISSIIGDLMDPVYTPWTQSETVAADVVELESYAFVTGGVDDHMFDPVPADGPVGTTVEQQFEEVAAAVSIAQTEAYPSFELVPFGELAATTQEDVLRNQHNVLLPLDPIAGGQLDQVSGFYRSNGGMWHPRVFNIVDCRSSKNVALEVDFCPECGASGVCSPFMLSTCPCRHSAMPSFGRGVQPEPLAYTIIGGHALREFPVFGLDYRDWGGGRAYVTSESYPRGHRHLHPLKLTRLDGTSWIADLASVDGTTPYVRWSTTDRVRTICATGPFARIVHHLLAAGCLHHDVVVDKTWSFVTIALLELGHHASAMVESSAGRRHPSRHAIAISAFKAACGAFAKFYIAQGLRKEVIWRLIIVRPERCLINDVYAFPYGVGWPEPTKPRLRSLYEICLRRLSHPRVEWPESCEVFPRFLTTRQCLFDMQDRVQLVPTKSHAAWAKTVRRATVLGTPFDDGFKSRPRSVPLSIMY